MNFVLQKNSLKRVKEKKLHSCHVFVEHYFPKETLSNNMSDLLENPVIYTSSSEERLLYSSSNTQTVTTTVTPLPHQILLHSDNVSVPDVCGRGKEEAEIRHCPQMQ
jgi:hypothetical protein